MIPETLFLACTRPAMRRGVPSGAFRANVMFTLEFGMIMGNPLWWFIGPVIHFAVLRPMTDYDPNFWRKLQMWVRTKGETRGRFVFGAPALIGLPELRAHSAEDVRTCV